MFCAWSLCALLLIQQNRLAAPPPRLFITRGSAATPRWEWERGKKRDIAEVQCHSLTKSMHSWLQVDADDDFSTSTTKRCSDGEGESPSHHPACCLHQAAGFGCSSHKKPVARCPMFHKLLLTFSSPVLHFNLTLPRWVHHFSDGNC